MERGGHLMLGGHSEDVARKVTAFLAGQDGPDGKHRCADGRHGVQPLSRAAEIRPLQERLFFQHEQRGARPRRGLPMSVKCRAHPKLSEPGLEYPTCCRDRRVQAPAVPHGRDRGQWLQYQVAAVNGVFYAIFAAIAWVSARAQAGTESRPVKRRDRHSDPVWPVGTTPGRGPPSYSGTQDTQNRRICVRRRASPIRRSRAPIRRCSDVGTTPIVPTSRLFRPGRGFACLVGHRR